MLNNSNKALKLALLSPEIAIKKIAFIIATFEDKDKCY
jgi:hypothetical protein